MGDGEGAEGHVAHRLVLPPNDRLPHALRHLPPGDVSAATPPVPLLARSRSPGRGCSAGSRLLSGHYIAGLFMPARRGFTRGQKHADKDNFLTPKGTTKITLTGRRALAPHALHCRLQRSLNQPTQPHRRAGALRHRSTETPPMDPPKDPLKDPLLLAKDPRNATKDLPGLRSRGKDGGSVAGAKERNPC